MRLATSTNLLFGRPDGSSLPLAETLKRGAEAGFRTFDMCFYDWVLPGSPFLTDGWRSWVEEIREEKEKLSVEFGQCHAHFYDFLSGQLTKEQQNRQQELVLRSIECCAILGSKVCVTHPDTDWRAMERVKLSKKANIEYFYELLNATERWGVTLAVENMCDFSLAPKKKYCAEPEELVDLVDSLGSDRIGICWDFEHARIMEQDQEQALRYLGNRLMATHVSDTHSKTEPDLMHVMPFFGDMKWEGIMKALREIGYRGDFSFEAHNFANRLPEPMIDTALKLSFQIGEYLISLGENEE